MIGKEKIARVLLELYKNDNNRTLTAKALGIARPNLYKILNTLRRENIIDSDRNVPFKFEVISLAEMYANTLIGMKRVDCINNTLLIYNPKRDEVHLNKFELREIYGREINNNELSLLLNDNYTAINFNYKPWTIEEIADIIADNENFYIWYRNKFDSNKEMV